MAQMGIRETEESVRIQPSVVAQAGATRPFPRLSGDQFTRENKKVACRSQTEGLGQLVFANENLNHTIRAFKTSWRLTFTFHNSTIVRLKDR